MIRNGASPISIHAPQWGATAAAAPGIAALMISIHAPQWGATEHEPGELVFGGISIHAPQWGATVTLSAQLPQSIFQSTHPSGVRHDGTATFRSDAVISIHAPQWGATKSPPTPSNGSRNFNPRTPVGCDRTGLGHRDRTAHFNPRTPVGCDFCAIPSLRIRGFQSTHPSGVRPREWA